MKNKPKIFNLSAISIIMCDCLQAVVCIFIDLFFISKVLKDGNASMQTNIFKIGLFYVIEYAILGISYSLTGFALKKINKSIFVSIGSILLTVVILTIYLLGPSVANFVPLVAVLYGLGWAFFSSGYHGLTNETISSKHQVRFFAVKRIAFQATYILFPISLGLIIDKVNFSVMAIIMLAICALLVLFSFLIKPKTHFNQEFNLRKFSIHIKQNKEQTKPLKLVYWSNFFRGASTDSFTTLITIFVMLNFGSNTSLGMFQTIFTAASLLAMFFYLKFYRKKRANAFILPTVILVALAITAIFITNSKPAVVVFYAVYTILNVILMSISDSRRSGVARVLSLHSHILESNAFAEFYLGAGRVVSSLLVLFAGVFDALLGNGSMLFLKIALGLVCFFYVMFGLSLIWVEKSLIKQDEEFRKTHEKEAIEKTED